MKVTKIGVKLSGLSDIMFDRFIDHSTEVRPVEQKLYLDENNRIVLPAENIISFLFGEYPTGAAKTFEGKKGKDYIRIGQSHVFIDEVLIPIRDEKGKDIFYDGMKGRLYAYKSAPRVRKGSLSIKCEMKARPTLKLPWIVNFNISLVENNIIDENKLYNWFQAGGMQIALGTYRPRFGRFDVADWKVKE